LERIIYERDKLKKRQQPEVTWIFVYDLLHPKEKYSDLLQMFTDNHLELKMKYGYYNF
jgi:hypothetical protein